MVQAAAWRQFALCLPKNAKLLDLATGDGIVLHHLRGCRSDLRLTGVDSAPGLPKSPSGMRLLPNIPIETLPFGDASMDAVTSQFGYEYSHTDEAAVEVARVLRPGGTFLFMIHDRSSPVVAHNSARFEALRWAGMESGLIDKARAVANARRTMPLPTPPSFGAAVTAARQRFPGQSVAAEFAQAVLQSLAPGPAPSAALGFLDQLERKMQSELARLDALAAAARDEAAVGKLIEELEDAGLDVQPKRQMKSPAGIPFAWDIRGTRTKRY
jgi:SAM-dependent methyltransferase